MIMIEECYKNYLGL